MFDGPPFTHGGGFGFGFLLLVIGAFIIWTRRGGRVPEQWTRRMTPAGAGASGGSAASSSSWAPPVPGSAAGSGTRVTSPSTPASPHMPAPAPEPVDSRRSRRRDRRARQDERGVGRPERRRTRGLVIAARVIGWLVVLASFPIVVALIAVNRADILSVPVAGLWLTLAILGVINLAVWSSASRSVAPVAASIVGLATLGIVVGAVSSWNGRIGESVSTPVRRTELLDTYRLAIGAQTVDLSGYDVASGPIQVTIDVGAGYSQVVVPDDVSVEVHAAVQGGVLSLFGTEHDGWNVTESASVDGATRTGGAAGEPSSTPRITVDADLEYGRFEICTASDAITVSGHLQCGQ
ncbi:MAG: LiaF-related protein [Ilumatobacteraceae bacterium]